MGAVIKQLDVVIDENLTVCFIATNPEPVGLLRLSPDGYVLGLFVNESARGQGLAKRMLILAFEWCRQKGLETMALSCKNDNEKALALYRKLGFLKYQPHDDDQYHQYVKVL